MRVDTRAGSNELIRPLRLAGVTVEECTLNSGDVEIMGNGPEGRPVLVGVEHKSVEDALASLRNGRLAEQLRRMHTDFECVWLCVEGEYRTGPGKWGRLQVKRGSRWTDAEGGYTVPEFHSGLLTMAQAGGTLLWVSRDQDESVRWLKALDRWWTAKDWEEHRAHLDWYKPEVPHNPWAGEPPLVQKVAFTLPHLGTVKAERAAKHFRSVKRMVDAMPEEWLNVEGVGKKIAEAVVKAVEEES